MSGTDMDAGTILRRSRVAEFRRIGEETIQVRLYGDVVDLDGVAAVLWRLFDGTRSLGEVVERVATQYGVPHDTVEQDVAEFAEEMLSRGLFTANPAAPGR